jgi:hypothetical protein
MGSLATASWTGVLTTKGDGSSSSSISSESISISITVPRASSFLCFFLMGEDVAGSTVPSDRRGDCGK